MTCPETGKPCETNCPTACVARMARINPKAMSMFEQPVGTDPVNGVIGGYAKDNGPVCPKCKSRDTEAVWRDAVWEETGCQCNTCGHDFIN